MIVARGTFLLLSFLLGGALLTFFPLSVRAQLEIPNMENSVFIHTVPEHPSPGDTVQLYAQSVFHELAKTNNVWTVNGKVVAQGIGVTEATFSVGALGSRNDIVFRSGSDTSAQISIVPTEIDLLFESNSYVPPFYHGRALPSEGTSIRVQAIPRFQRTDGSFIAASSLIYTWKRNGSVINAVSGKGKSTALLPSPVLFGADTIVVDVATTDDTMSGTASISIPSTKPLLLLYEDHPLFGMTYHKALAAETFVPESEATFTAVPYYANAASPNDPSFNYDWVVNDRHISPDSVQRSSITISSAGQKTGLARIQLELTQPQNSFFGARGEWGISFSALRNGKDSRVPVANPFLPQ